jgi:hypothetical protein
VVLNRSVAVYLIPARTPLSRLLADALVSKF